MSTSTDISFVSVSGGHRTFTANYSVSTVTGDTVLKLMAIVNRRNAVEEVATIANYPLLLDTNVNTFTSTDDGSLINGLVYDVTLVMVVRRTSGSSSSTVVYKSDVLQVTPFDATVPVGPDEGPLLIIDSSANEMETSSTNKQITFYVDAGMPILIEGTNNLELLEKCAINSITVLACTGEGNIRAFTYDAITGSGNEGDITVQAKNADGSFNQFFRDNFVADPSLSAYLGHIPRIFKITIGGSSSHSLDAGYEHEVELYATNWYGTSDATVPFKRFTRLDKVSGVTASSDGNQLLTVSWNAYTSLTQVDQLDASGNVIEAEDDITNYIIDVYDPSANTNDPIYSYDMSGAITNTYSVDMSALFVYNHTYTVTVTAVSEAVRGYPSSAASFTTYANPSNYDISMVTITYGDHQADISWNFTDVSLNGLIVVGYQVVYGAYSYNAITTTDLIGNTTITTYDGNNSLVNGTQYDFSLNVLLTEPANGNVTWTYPYTLTAIPYGTSTYTSNVALTVSDQTITASVDAYSDASLNGYDVSVNAYSYDLSYNGAINDLKHVDSSLASNMWTGLTNGTVYEVIAKLNAITPISNAPISLGESRASGIPYGSPVFTIASIGASVAYGDASATVSWGGISESDLNGNQFEILECYITNGSGYNASVAFNTAGSRPFTGLSNGTVYFVTFTLNLSNHNNSAVELGGVFELRVVPFAPASVPTSFSITGENLTAGGNAAKLNWSAPSSIGAAVVDYYNIWYCATSSGEYAVDGSVNGTTTTYTKTTGLVNGTTGFYKVQAVTTNTNYVGYATNNNIGYAGSTDPMATNVAGALTDAVEFVPYNNVVPGVSSLSVDKTIDSVDNSVDIYMDISMGSALGQGGVLLDSNGQSLGLTLVHYQLEYKINSGSWTSINNGTSTHFVVPSTPNVGDTFALKVQVYANIPTADITNPNDDTSPISTSTWSTEQSYTYSGRPMFNISTSALSNGNTVATFNVSPAASQLENIVLLATFNGGSSGYKRMEWDATGFPSTGGDGTAYLTYAFQSSDFSVATGTPFTSVWMIVANGNGFSEHTLVA